jgi:cytochrome c biogenesis protein
MKHRGSVKRSIAPEEAIEAAREVLSKNFGKVTENRDEESVTLFVDKGWYGRMGAYIVHLSILILAIGALVGGIRGFKGYVNILEGQAVDRVPLRNRNTAMKLDFSVRCDDFRIEYYPGTQQPKDYFSDLTVLKNGREIRKKRIEVNHPLIVGGILGGFFDGIYFYQSSYGVDRRSTVTLEVLDPSGKITGPSVTVPTGKEFRVLGDPSAYAVEELIPNIAGGRPGAKMARFLGNSHMDFYVLAAAPNRDRMRGGPVYFRIKDTNILEYTGLQVAYDPGVPIVWLGCIVMMLGLGFAFFVAHQRVWIRVDLDTDETAVLIAGTSNRNPASFEKGFETALGQLREAVKANKD